MVLPIDALGDYIVLLNLLVDHDDVPVCSIDSSVAHALSSYHTIGLAHRPAFGFGFVPSPPF